MVELKSTLHALSDKRYLCGECINMHSDKPDLLKKKQMQMSCAVDAHQWGVHKIVDNETVYSYKRCIGNYFSQSVLTWLSIFRASENGILPYAGGYQDQPNKALEVLGVIEATKNIEQIKKIEEDKRRIHSRAKRGR